MGLKQHFGDALAVLLQMRAEHRDVAGLDQRRGCEAELLADFHHRFVAGAFDLDEFSKMGNFIELDAAGIELPALAALLIAQRLLESELLEEQGHGVGIGEGGLDFLALFQLAMSDGAFVSEQRLGFVRFHIRCDAQAKAFIGGQKRSIRSVEKRVGFDMLAK